ncbi:FAD-dependent oxidoreductase [Ramlibacter sp. H39-3-26]|uniref:flavin monoamine oxidase family protein n=1 Tax=Curvibacter soli TaxID=3031331 RepID=UPI0023DB4AC2|nr:FAD-dependent oxidoreductase [Ramlibacter sp. H39-3-26]MDF1484074.1 FAD-dependent oxidoreductase [Ramlibacter sp. H39-3-26]
MAVVQPLVADVAIVGAGLCGLALARSLHAQGLSAVVVEARERLGGRVLTRRCEATGQALDMGPAWFWPDTEPRIAALLAELGLASAPQHDPGDALWLTDPNREPERREETGGVHAGAYRIKGGAARLVEALAATLPAGSVHPGSALRLLRDRGAWLELQLEEGQEGGRRMRLLRARHAVLALPPRLVLERIAFDPPLPAALVDALAATPTWMAAQAKAVTTYSRPFWRTAGHSGNAFVRHAQAMLGEVFDASDDATGAGALGGFVALGAAQRVNFRRGMPMLIESQLVQLYGAQAQQDGRQHVCDWADEPWTCSAADRAGQPEPPQADPALRRPHWAGRLYFGGSESATHGAGHMEGALESAARIARALAPVRAAAPGAADAGDALSRFKATVAARCAQAPLHYRQHLARLLSCQQAEQLTQRALLATVEQVYSETLVALDGLLPGLGLERAGPVAAGRHALTPVLLAAFDGWNGQLLSEALAFNGGSCALSNFPDEHQPDTVLRRAIALDLAAAWREFALELNGRLMAASTNADARRTAVPA